MRERAVATVTIWISAAVSIYLLLDRLTYVEYQIVDGMRVTEGVVVQAPSLMQLAIFVLIFFLILFAFAATYMIWDKAHLSGQNPEQQGAKESTKLKREQKERVRRLLEQMDDDDLAALETRLSDDGEIISMDELLDERELQRRR